METALDWVTAEPDRWAGWQGAVGPSVLLLGCGASVAANLIWGRMIGNVACGWRLAFSPRGPAFGIWSVIYTWTFASIVCQFLANMDPERWYCAEFGPNVLMCVAWLACALWIWFFGLADSRDVRDGLGWAACCLVTAATCALVAVVWEHSWRSGSVVRILAVGVPFSLFSGWITLASSLSVGVFLASETRPQDECGENGQLVQLRVPGSFESWAPTVLALAVTAFAVGIPDPILTVSVCWGTFWMPTGVRVLPLAVASVAFVASVVRVWLFLW